jgi:hypothetical protein
MDADEKEICAYLKSLPGQFISGREIARRAGGKWRFRESPDWVAPVLARLVERKLLESDSTGHYRLAPRTRGEKTNKWVSPQIRQILRNSGKDFGEVTRVDEDEGF